MLFLVEEQDIKNIFLAYVRDLGKQNFLFISAILNPLVPKGSPFDE